MVRRLLRHRQLCVLFLQTPHYTLIMPSGDLQDYATSDTDFYSLLGITFETSQRDIDRAWRKTALKYHPDKVGNGSVAKEKFHLAQIGYDLLSDPTTKVLYDNTRNARLQKKRQNELFDGRRRQMKDDLEARERGVKRGREEEEGDEEKLEREIRRLAEDGKRRRKEKEDLLRKEMQQEAERGSTNGLGAKTSGIHSGNGATNNNQGVSELDRTVKVRWPHSSQSAKITEHHITTLFSRFGKIESAHLLNPKMLRLGAKQKKQLVAICMIQFASVVGAHAAVEDFQKQQGPEWDLFDSVFWAANKEPDFLTSYPTSSRSGRAMSPADFSNQDNRPSTPSASTNIGADGLRKMPSFTSFSPAAFKSPKASPYSKGPGVNSPSLEEMTMIRLKNAEKKRLADEIRRQDEEAAAGVAVK